MRTTNYLATLLLAVGLAVPARPDVLYAFQGSVPVDGSSIPLFGSFVYVVPDFLKFTSPQQFINVPCSALASSFNCRDEGGATGVSFAHLGGTYDESVVFFRGAGFLFSGDVYGTPGAYVSEFFNDPGVTVKASLQIQLYQPAAGDVLQPAVPEPSTFLTVLLAAVAALVARFLFARFRSSQ